MTAERVTTVAVTVAVGVLTGLAGTLMHRWHAGDLPVGMALALLTVLVGGVLARAAADGAGLLLTGLAGLVTVQVLTLAGPGGDVVVTDQALSYVWLLGQPLVTAAAALAPRRWFSDEPVPLPRHGAAGA